MNTEKENIITALRRFINQRSGIEAGNYIRDWRDQDGIRALRADQRSIQKDGREARELLQFMEDREGITGEMIKEGFRAFSGRLSWDGNSLDYCAGQYFPTEYRKAVCAVLAQVVWDYWREDGKGGTLTADQIRKNAAIRFGRAIASRWFN